ncbi:hypothetical protein EAK82_26675 [Salmonella enterica]|uniref:Uncharacterized protein n=1 Tax=Salmonella enterica TaxID=28901 RepID=A0A403N4N6_SALER|nr:hypothetical protein [Salmonella enterica]
MFWRPVISLVVPVTASFFRAQHESALLHLPVMGDRCENGGVRFQLWRVQAYCTAGGRKTGKSAGLHMAANTENRADRK